MPRLPAEILRSIAESLAEDASHCWKESPYKRPISRTDVNLRSFAIASKVLHEIMRPFIFRRILLDNEESSKRLMNAVNFNPCLIVHIETLEIKTDFHMYDPYESATIDPWVFWLSSKESKSFLSRLSSVKTLVITECSAFATFYRIIDDFINAIIRVPNVECFQFQYTKEWNPRLWESLISKSKVACLSIDSTNVIDRYLNEEEDLGLRMKCPHLDHMFVSYSIMVGGPTYFGLINIGWGIPNIQMLSKIELDMRSYDPEQVEELRIVRHQAMDSFLVYLTKIGRQFSCIGLKDLTLRYVGYSAVMCSGCEKTHPCPSCTTPRLIGSDLDELLTADPRPFKDIQLNLTLDCHPHQLQWLFCRVEELLPQLRKQGRLAISVE
jgi:hypothetical protein